jgi:hypothetical protein
VVEKILSDAAGNVLEKMFFVTALDEPRTAAAPAMGTTVRVAFEGDPPGRLEVAVARGVERSMAADFLGEAEVTDSQAREVVRELANMICGAALSRLESGIFRLGAPEIVEGPVGGGGVSYTASIGPGALRVTLYTERPLCPVVERPEF